MIESNFQKFSAPWDLKGKGYIILYPLSKKYVESQAMLPTFLKGHSKGGLGAVMIVNYESSNVGPYSELLFIPGKFHFASQSLNTISKIYVSTMASVNNGINNWGIPKELAEFKFELLETESLSSNSSTLEKITVTKNGSLIAEWIIHSGRIPFPVNTKLMPFPLVQQQDDKNYYTTFQGKGTGYLCHVNYHKVNRKLFPDFISRPYLAAIKVDPFKLIFHPAKIETISKDNL